MAYPTLPGRAIPYHNDGTVVKVLKVSDGIIHTFTAAELADLNDYDYEDVYHETEVFDYLVFHFPERRHLRAVFAYVHIQFDYSRWRSPESVEGSNDTTNGLDGTWVAAVPDNSWGPTGMKPDEVAFDMWRRPFTGQFPNDGAFSTWRIKFHDVTQASYFIIAHLYGHKAAGETPDDLLWVDPSTGAELALPLDFGAVPAGTSSILQAALKNASDSLTAQNITTSVNDPDDIIRVGWSANGPWEVSLTIDSLAPGVQSDTIYIKAEPPAPPTPLKPHRAPISAEVGAWV